MLFALRQGQLLALGLLGLLGPVFVVLGLLPSTAQVLPARLLWTHVLGNLEPTNKQEVPEVQRFKFIHPSKTNGLENLLNKIFHNSQVVMAHDNPEQASASAMEVIVSSCWGSQTSPRPVAWNWNFLISLPGGYHEEKPKLKTMESLQNLENLIFSMKISPGQLHCQFASGFGSVLGKGSDLLYHQPQQPLQRIKILHQ